MFAKGWKAREEKAASFREREAERLALASLYNKQVAHLIEEKVYGQPVVAVPAQETTALETVVVTDAVSETEQAAAVEDTTADMPSTEDGSVKDEAKKPVAQKGRKKAA